MKNKIEIRTIGGALLFSYECENNDVKKTLLWAIKQKANLRRANLQGADLEWAYLEGAYLEGAKKEVSP